MTAVLPAGKRYKDDPTITAAVLPASKRCKDDPTITTDVLPAGKRYKDDPTITTAVLPAGKRYKDDPTIMTWEVANEPHTSDNFETDWEGRALGDQAYTPRKATTGGLVAGFICRAATLLKGLAPQQLIASGVLPRQPVNTR
jgi:hypothetical protein